MLRYLAIFLVLALSASASLTSCPTIKAVAENSKISASWEGYNPREIVSFEWAVVEGSFSHDDHVCSSRPLFYGLPDTMTWTHVRKSSQVDSQSLNLDRSKEYRVVLRITSQDGTLVWVSSAPVEFSESVRVESTRKPSEKLVCETLPNDCEIDKNNTCRSAEISPRQKMDVLYGAPQWPNRVGANSIFRE